MLQMDDSFRSAVVAGEAMGSGAAAEGPSRLLAQSLFYQALEGFGSRLVRAEPADQEPRPDQCLIPLEPEVEEPVRVGQSSLVLRPVHKPFLAKPGYAVRRCRRGHPRRLGQRADRRVQQSRPHQQRENDLLTRGTHATALPRAAFRWAPLDLRDVPTADLQAAV